MLRISAICTAASTSKEYTRRCESSDLPAPSFAANLIKATPAASLSLLKALTHKESRPSSYYDPTGSRHHRRRREVAFLIFIIAKLTPSAGGPAGCVTAGRLARADPNLQVLLIEAGANNHEGTIGFLLRERSG